MFLQNEGQLLTGLKEMLRKFRGNYVYDLYEKKFVDKV
jgi:hypothetical protein